MPVVGMFTVTFAVLVSVAEQVVLLMVCVAVATTVYSPPCAAVMLLSVTF